MASLGACNQSASALADKYSAGTPHGDSPGGGHPNSRTRPSGRGETTDLARRVIPHQSKESDRTQWQIGIEGKGEEPRSKLPRSELSIFWLFP